MINLKNKELLHALGKRIYDLRKSKNMTQKDLAHEADVEISQIGRIERGRINSTIITLNAIANALEVDLKNLVDLKMHK